MEDFCIINALPGMLHQKYVFIYKEYIKKSKLVSIDPSLSKFLHSIIAIVHLTEIIDISLNALCPQHKL